MIHLSRDLDRLKRRILSMGALVEAAVDRAISALLDRRPDLAREAIRGDERIDREEVDLEEECLKVLALHQPFAVDLRFIITVVKVNNDLERMGDLATNIAEQAVALSELPELGIPLDLDGMTDCVRSMVRRALDALVHHDTGLAREVLGSDEEVDDYHEKMYQVLHGLMVADISRIAPAIHTLSASRDLERIADLATNIAENVVFLVDGDVIRHGRALDREEG